MEFQRRGHGIESRRSNLETRDNCFNSPDTCDDNFSSSKAMILAGIDAILAIAWRSLKNSGLQRG